MATWVVTNFTVTGSPTSDANADFGLTINETAPGDFDPAGVTAVAFSSLLATGSGFGDDLWHAGSLAIGNQTIALATALTGGTVLASNVATVASDQANADSANIQKQAISTAGTGGTINTGQTVAAWEGAVLRRGSGLVGEYFEYDKTKGGDGTAITFNSASLTITYTPAAPSESVTVPITGTVAVSDTVAYNESVTAAITASVAVTDTVPSNDYTVVQSKSATSSGTTSVSVTMDSAITEGNLLVAIMGERGSTRPGAATLPTGFAVSVEVENTTEADWLGLYHKLAGASESTTITFSSLATDDHNLTVMEVAPPTGKTFATSPLDVTASTGRNAGVTSLATGTTATTTVADEVAVGGLFARADISAISASNSYTVETDHFATSGQPTEIVMAALLLSATGTTSTTFSWTTAAVSMAAVATYKLEAGSNAFDESVTVAITGSVSVTDDHNVVYDETGRSVAVTGSVAVADTINFTDSVTVAITSTVAATDAHGHNESVTVAITATVDVTDVLTDVTQYDETGRSVAITSSVTATDSKGMSESVSVAITSSVTSTDTANFTDSTTVAITGGVTVSDTYTGAQTFDETGRSVAITATVSATDAQGWNESVTVAVTSSVTSTDQASYTEATTASITSSVTATDTAAFTESTAVAITSSVAATEVYGRAESVSIPVTSTVSSTDTAAFTDSLTVNITGSVDVTDLYSQPGAFDETGRDVNITGSVGVADLLSATDTSAVAIVGSVDVQDQLATSESVAVGISSTVTVTDVFTGVGYTESLTVAVVATVAGTDALSSSDSTTVAVTAVVSSLDTHAMSESVSIDITAGVTVTDIDAGGESVTVPITASVAVSDTYTPAPSVESVTVPITSSIASSDAQGMDERFGPGHTGRLPITIFGTVVVTDGHGYSESRLVAITGTVAASEQWTQRESILVDITSSISSLDILAAVESPSVDIIGTVIVSDGGAINESRTVDITAVIEVNEQWYMLLPNQSDGPGRGTGATGPAYPGLRTPKGETDHANTVGKAE